MSEFTILDGLMILVVGPICVVVLSLMILALFGEFNRRR